MPSKFKTEMLINLSNANLDKRILCNHSSFRPRNSENGVKGCVGTRMQCHVLVHHLLVIQTEILLLKLELYWICNSMKNKTWTRIERRILSQIQTH